MEGVALPSRTCWVCGGRVTAVFLYGDLIYRCVDERVIGDRDAILGSSR